MKRIEMQNNVVWFDEDGRLLASVEPFQGLGNMSLFAAYVDGDKSHVYVDKASATVAVEKQLSPSVGMDAV